jgi:hypothetical protein
MKRKKDHTLRNLLIAFIVLIVAAVAVHVCIGLFYYLPRRLDAQEKMINLVRYIRLCQPDEFYAEIMTLPDGYVQASNLKTKLVKLAPETPRTYGYRYLLSGPGLLRQYAGHIYVKKEGRFLCVAVVNFPPESSFLYPAGGWRGECFEMFHADDETNTAESEESAEKSYLEIKDWNIDRYEILQTGIPFIPWSDPLIIDLQPVPSTQETKN